ncbi:MAG: flagellar hook-length control protein FliK, partial [Candidatus Marinimicrobia bacterium]|nr:flagellar hook-length control protein FliK [Candidatus Neomarinimicrobiota bacterium]
GEGLKRPLNSLELRSLIDSLGIDIEARITRSINEKNFSSYQDFPPLRRMLFNDLSSQLSTLSNNKLSSEKFRVVKSGIELFQALFEREPPSSGSSLAVPATSTLSRLYTTRAAQSLNFFGVTPDSLNLIALEALLESDYPVTRDEINSLNNIISSFLVKSGTRQEIKSLMMAALYLKRMKLNRTMENALFISRVVESRNNVSRILSVLLDNDFPQALNLPDGIDKLHEITKRLSGLMSGKTVRFEEIIRFSTALGIEVPQELRNQFSVPLSQFKEFDARKIMQKVQTELNSTIEKLSPAKLFSGNFRALIKLYSLERSIRAVIAGKMPGSLPDIEEYLTEPGSHLNALERKIAARLIARQIDPTQALIKKISNYLKNYSGADKDNQGTIKIERAVRAVISRMPLNGITWRLLKPLDAISPALSRSAMQYLELISQSELHTESNDRMKGILELLIAVSTGKPDQKSLIKMSSLLDNSTMNNRLIGHSRANSKQVEQLTETVKNQLLRIKEELNRHSTKKSVKEVESLLRALSTALERLEILQTNNSRKEGLFQFLLPFPDTPDGGQANFRYSKKESAGDDEDFSISLKLSPEPIGPIEITLRKLQTGVVATLIIKRREYLELISENIHLLTRRFESIGFGEVNVSCTVSRNPEVKRGRLTGLYA